MAERPWERQARALAIDPRFAKHRDRISARGDGFATDVLCARMDDAMFSEYMELTLRADHNGVIEFRYNADLFPPPKALNELFRWLLVQLDVPREDRRQVVPLRVAFIALAELGAVRADNGRFLVHAYWR